MREAIGAFLASFTAAFGRRASETASTTFAIAVTVYLVTLIAFLLYLVSAILAAYQFQDRLASVTQATNGSLVAAIQDARIAARLDRELTEVGEELSKLGPAETGDDTAPGPEYWSRLDALLRGTESTYQLGLNSVLSADQYRGYLEGIPQGSLSQDNLDLANQIIEDFDEALREFASRSATNGSNDGAQSNDERAVLETRERSLRSRIDEARAKTEEYDALVNLGRELRELSEACVFGISERSRFFCIGSFAEQARSILVLALTIAMGAVGSSIYITEQYVSGQAGGRSLQWFIVRPLLGVVTAIAIYILARSGQLAFSDESSSAAGLNPWTISFLAIISGLLSEQAIKKIGAAGRSFFSTEGEHERPRWLLTARLPKNTAATGELRAALDTTDELLSDWLQGRVAVPEAKQEIIAAWCKTARRELFTDLPP